MNTKHVVFYKIFRPLAALFVRFKFGYRYEIAKDLPETYIVLSNHTTDYDPVMVASSFPRQMYFVASEHISRWKLLYAFLKFGFDPIIRYKGTVAASTVKDVLKKTKSGNNVCIFAEGYRTWDGVTCPILPSTGKLVKNSRCGLVTYKITGGYFVSPNWSQGGTRRGEIHGAPVNVYTKEELAAMTADEINEIIRRDLYEDAYARQMAEPKRYRGKQPAYRMENLLFICPECGKIDTMVSGGDRVSCSACGMSFRYNDYGMLEGAPFDTVRDLAAWQKEEVKKAAAEGVTYTAAGGTLIKIENRQEIPVARGMISLSPESVRCGDTEILLEDIMEMAMHGRHAIVFSAKKTYYELLPDDGQNALKFQLLFEEYKERNAEKTAKTAEKCSE